MARSIMDAYLGTRPPSEIEVNRMLHGQQQTANMFGAGYVPMQAATVYTNTELIDGFRQGAIDSGLVMDQLEVVRYDSVNVYEMSRRTATIMGSMPASEHSRLIDYKVLSNNITDTEIRDMSYFHTGIDYGPNKSMSAHVDQEHIEVPSEEERLAIAYNNQLLNLMIKNELDEYELNELDE